MNTIRFRARKATGESWVGSLDDILRHAETVPAWLYEFPAITKDRSTGLTDKNGKEIFEGDIMEWKAGRWRDACGIEEKEDRRKVVEWSAWAWNPFDYQGYDGDTLFHPREAVVIGNIHENPDLLPRAA